MAATQPAAKGTPPTATGGFERTFEPSKVHQAIYTVPADLQTRYKAEREEKYRNALNALPQRGGGLHGALQTVCNFGVSAQIPGQTLLREIVATDRAFRRGEIEEAISKARHDVGKQPRSAFRSKTSGQYIAERLADDARAKALQFVMIEKGGGSIDPFGAEVWEASNPRPGAVDRVGGLDGSECCADMLLFLSELYQPEDILFIGTGYEKTERQLEHIKTAAQWMEFFSREFDGIRNETNEREQFYKIQRLAANYPFFIVNPLTGERDANGSYRSDTNVAAFRYIVVESDTLPLEKQLALLNGLRLPIASMTYTGGKSIHALLDAAALNDGKAITSLDEWRRVVKSNLFGQIAPLGFDKQTSNPSRLSRLPGIFRPDKDKFQPLLYVNRKGGTLCLN